MSNATRWIKRVLWAAGFMLLGYSGMAWFDARLRQAEGNMELDRLVNNQSARAPLPVYRPSRGELIGRITVQRLGMSAVVFEGTDTQVLHRGVGHLAGSALPGQPGNVVLAGHRDSFFRNLRNIRKGDNVDVTTEFGTRHYQITSTEIVSPTETSVAGPTQNPTLTLITCYPFNYIGSAPKRFIIRGQEEEELSARTAAATTAQPSATTPTAEASTLRFLRYLFGLAG